MRMKKTVLVLVSQEGIFLENMGTNATLNVQTEARVIVPPVNVCVLKGAVELVAAT